MHITAHHPFLRVAEESASPRCGGADHTALRFDLIWRSQRSQRSHPSAPSPPQRGKAERSPLLREVEVRSALIWFDLAKPSALRAASHCGAAPKKPKKPNCFTPQSGVRSTAERIGFAKAKQPATRTASPMPKKPNRKAELESRCEALLLTL